MEDIFNNKENSYSKYYTPKPKIGDKGGLLGRPPVSKKDKLTQINFTTTSLENEIFEKASKELGRNFSNFAHYSISNFLKQEFKNDTIQHDEYFSLIEKNKSKKNSYNVVSVNNEEKEILKKIAKENNCTISYLMRYIMYKYIKTNMIHIIEEYELIFKKYEYLNQKHPKKTHMSTGEITIIQSLEKYNIPYIYNKSIKTIFKELNLGINWNEFIIEFEANLVANNINYKTSKIERFRPDFVLYKNKNNKIIGVIEFDGAQHFNIILYFFKTIEEFLRRSNTDFIKNSLWEYLNIPMLRIRYDQVNLIDNMIWDFINNPRNYISKHNLYLSEEEYWSKLKNTLKKLDNNDNLGYAM